MTKPGKDPSFPPGGDPENEEIGRTSKNFPLFQPLQFLIRISKHSPKYLMIVLAKARRKGEVTAQLF
jgi:hypothetical protein